MNWQTLVAALINCVVVLGIVQLLKVYIPVLNEKVPWILPMFASLIGVLIVPLQTYLAELLGVPIDLSPIVGAFTGASAVAIHQIGIQASK